MIENKQQTPVEWLVEQFKEYDFADVKDTENYIIKMQSFVLTEKLEQAKEMEKQQRSIELPSDEEIGKEASVRHYGTNFKNVFASGAKWMRNKIQGGEQ